MSDAVLVQGSSLERLAKLAEARWPTFRLWAPAGSGGPAPEDFGRIRVLIVPGNAPVDASLMDRFPNLRLIAGLAAGYEGVGLEAARVRGIRVTNAALDDNRDMADWALGALIVLLRDMLGGDRMIREGRWGAGWPQLGHSLTARQVGIVGLGGIGRAVAERCAALGMTVSWWGTRPKDAPWLRADSLAALARDSDALVLACPLTADTRHLVDAPILEALGRTGFLVNVARGAVADEEALIAALRDGTIAGAALDVFENEPTDPARWAGLPNLLLSPHRAGSTQERVRAMMDRCLDNVAAAMENRPLLDRVG
jgi:lactate dehydrogenase-like 2-hydroxyacid dehydrogenase